jgi:hypothetical protein
LPWNLQSFAGTPEEDVEEWIRIVEFTFESRGVDRKTWVTTATQFVVPISPAGRWRQVNLDALRTMGWTKFVSELKQYFPSKTTRHQRLKLWRAVAMSANSLKAAQEFASEFQRLLMCIDPAPADEVTVRQFLDGLKDDVLRGKLIEVYDRKPSKGWEYFRERC